MFKQLGANLSDEAFDALTADGLYVGYIPTTSCPCKQQWAYINVKSLSANANDVIQEVIGIASAITCTRMKNSGTWGGWVLAPTRAEMDAVQNLLRVEIVPKNGTKTITVTNPCWIFANEADNAMFFGMASGNYINDVKNTLSEVSLARPNATTLTVTNNREWAIRVWLLQYY